MKNWNIDPEKIIHTISDAWAFWKDKKGKYLGCNDIMATDLKLPVIKVIGTKDHHLPILPQEANHYLTIPCIWKCKQVAARL